jgi:hypothetical protein
MYLMWPSVALSSMQLFEIIAMACRMVVNPSSANELNIRKYAA